MDLKSLQPELIKPCDGHSPLRPDHSRGAGASADDDYNGPWVRDDFARRQQELSESGRCFHPLQGEWHRRIARRGRRWPRWRRGGAIRRYTPPISSLRSERCSPRPPTSSPGS